MSDLSKALREKLPGPRRRRAGIVGDETAADGTRKWLVKVDGANAVESVFIPETDRATLCVSARPAACSTARSARPASRASTATSAPPRSSASSGSRTASWAVKRRTDRVISNVVFMGMGEPLLNLDNVIPAVRLMIDDNAYGLSRRRVTVSTSGVIPGMDRLRDECPVALAVSLHAPNDALRDELVPLNRKYPLRELIAACNRYLEKAPRDFITFEYVMLDGVNDGEALARELRRSRAKCAASTT